MKPIRKLILENKNHDKERSHHVMIYDFNGKRVRFTYRSYNAGEDFNGEIFDGNKWNDIFTLSDLGRFPNSNSFINTAGVRESEAMKLLQKGIEFINAIL